MAVNLIDYYRPRKPRRDMYGLKSRFDRLGEFESPGLYEMGARREGMPAPARPTTAIPPEPSAEAITTPSPINLLQTLKGTPAAALAGNVPVGKGKTPMYDYWKSPVIGKMPLDQFPFHLIHCLLLP